MAAVAVRVRVDVDEFKEFSQPNRFYRGWMGGTILLCALAVAGNSLAHHTCGNSINTLGWDVDDLDIDDLVDYAKVVPIGVDDIMLLQEQGFAYFAW